MAIMTKYEKKSLSDIVVSYVKNRILSGSLKSGDKLIESEISSELKISRAPVREAMRILNEQGSVSFSPRKGNQVLEMSPKEILEIFEIRISLEIQVLNILVTQNILQEGDYQKLENLTLQLLDGEQLCSKDEERVFLLNTLDLSFHRYLWNASESRRRMQILEGLFYQLLLVMNQNIVSLGSFEEKAQEHLRIINALKTKQLPIVLEEFQHHMHKYIEITLGDNMQLLPDFLTGIKPGKDQSN
ncbi:GntR family transcriptional regulator [Dehalobacterium formicoaceticum]|uniref:GntR family transcriptional regulator n=1 Tax=Dehalobacterium formicoaceticum TaxID=51515 RepID=A0ABT1Y112_9FIRM|nr:GntR family transcriptional regulator [Dehalobacterium formicoaceticum]MCR6544559.1 GntR family transcriptional regulator [Dehalobacterium formicoaceticum]